MSFSVRGFSVPKLGNTAQECQDAFLYSADVGNFAISDGATVLSFRSKQWATKLVEEFVKNTPPLGGIDAELQKWLVPIQQEWRESVRRDWDHLPWFLRNQSH